VTTKLNRPGFRIICYLLAASAIFYFFYNHDSRRDTASQNVATARQAKLSNRPEQRSDRRWQSQPLNNRTQLLFAIARGQISAEDAWKQIEKLGVSSTEADSTKDSIIETIAKNEGAESALVFLNSHVGPGALRRRLLHSVFYNACNDLDGAAAVLDKLEFPKEELAVAIAAIGSSYVTHEKEGFSVRDVIKKLPSEAILPISNSLIYSWRHNTVAGTGLVREADARNLLQDISTSPIPQKEKDQILANVFDTLTGEFPDVAWKLMKEMPEQIGQVSKDTKESLISGMVSNNANKAFASLLEYTGPAKSELIEIAAYRVAKRDMADVSSVMNSIPSLMQGDAKDAFSLGIVKFSMESGNIDSAKSWMNHIEGEKARAAASKLISKVK
jgi:hypothetical protein